MSHRKLPVFARLRANAFNIGLFLAVLAVLAALAWAGYAVRRWVNWNLSYEGDVQAEICRAVKPEHLRPEYLKNC